MKADDRSIEERLADQFYSRIHRTQRHDFRPWTSIGHEERTPWMEMAKEALRIAEWCVKEQVLSSHGEKASLSDHGVQVTLPPKDWKP